MQLHTHLFLYQLLAKRLQHLLVIDSRDTQRQLLAEFTRHLPTPCRDLIMVDRLLLNLIHLADQFRLRTMHANQKTAHALDRSNNPLGVFLQRIATRQFVNIRGNLLPSAQVEIPHAEVRALNPDICQDSMQTLFKLRLDVVEYL